MPEEGVEYTFVLGNLKPYVTQLQAILDANGYGESIDAVLALGFLFVGTAKQFMEEEDMVTMVRDFYRVVPLVTRGEG